MAANTARLAPIARAWALVIAGLQIIAPLLPERWTWGIWPATYTPLAWRLVLALVAATLILAGDRIVEWLVQAAPRILRSLNLASPRFRLVVAVLAAIPFYLFRIRHLQWGDAALLVKALGDPYRITYIWQAPLDVFIHAKIWQISHPVFGWADPTPVYNILSTCAGTVFVYILLSVAQLLGRSRSERWLIVGLVGTLGTMQLFFGYIENYPLMTVGVLLYTWLGVRTLRGKLHLVWPATALAVTHAFHPSTIILTPSLLYLLWRGNFVMQAGVLRNDDTIAAGDTRPAAQARMRSTPEASPVSPVHRGTRWEASPQLRGVLSIAAPYVLVFAGVVALMEGGGHGLSALATVDFPGGGDRQWFVPLFKITTEWQHYTMFSLGHLTDIVNQQFLVAPVVWPMLILLALLAWRRLPWQDPIARFLALMTGFYLLLTLTWNADYGGQKDWDLFSPASVPAALLLAYVLPRAIEARKYWVGAGCALIAAQGYHTLLWIARNTIP